MPGALRHLIQTSVDASVTPRLGAGPSSNNLYDAMGRFCYTTYPQGFANTGDTYMDSMDRLTGDIPRPCRCIDDTLTYDDSIKAAFFRACNFLDMCGNNGVTCDM